MKRRYLVEATEYIKNEGENTLKKYFTKKESVDKYVYRTYKIMKKWDNWGYIYVLEYDYDRNEYYTIDYIDNEKPEKVDVVLKTT